MRGFSARSVTLKKAVELPYADVLVIDDDEPVRSVMERVLVDAGYTVNSVENGLLALTAIQESHYRAIVCDIRMPVVDGVRFHEYLASGFPALANRVLFVTAVADEPKMAAYLAGSGCRVLEKPYELKSLVQEVAKLVGRAPRPGALL